MSTGSLLPLSHAPSSAAAAARVPLVVDLDGTLVATDTLWETLMAFLKTHPGAAFKLIGWIVRGKAFFKQQLAASSPLDVAGLPFRPECLDWLREERLSGRQIWLATGADLAIAGAIADHLGFFTGVIASNGHNNATGANKVKLIASTLGAGAYEYAGNSMADVAVWQHAESAIVVAPDSGVLAALKRRNIPVARHFASPSIKWGTWLRALRVHQWVKNLLVFTPLLTSHRIFDGPGWMRAACGFAVFSLVASATYLVNDLFDLSADRRHVTKSARPLAAGLISIPKALTAACGLIVMAAVLSLFLPGAAALLVLGYLVGTLIYSTVLKKLLIADVVALALFYTARLLYGGLVTGIEISIWTLAFCALSFFSLAAAKRINDLAKAGLGPEEVLRHRAYRAQDLNALISMSAATCNMAVLVLIFYINSQQGEKLYRHPQILWTMCIPLLYWFNRILTLANRGALADDPIQFATRDRATYAVLAAMGFIAVAAT